MNLDEYLTPKQAYEKGYAPSQLSINAQIRRGVLPSVEVVPGRVLIHIKDLEEMVERREYWKNHRHNKNRGRKHTKEAYNSRRTTNMPIESASSVSNKE